MFTNKSSCVLLNNKFLQYKLLEEKVQNLVHYVYRQSSWNVLAIGKLMS